MLTGRSSGMWVSSHLVVEWEDALGLPLRQLPGKWTQRALKRLPACATSLWLHDGSTFVKFDMHALAGEPNYLNRGNVVPWIIDYHVADADMPLFAKAYDRCGRVVVSSREAYERLLGLRCPLPLAHVALSLPDALLPAPDATFDKKYDCAEMGRTNPVMQGWLERYAGEHPGFTYLRRTMTSDARGNHFLYSTNRGEVVGDVPDRAGFLGLMRQVRVGLYSSPGLDGGATRTKGFNQVTVRPMEYLSQGCHVIGRYAENADSEWWGLREMVPNVGDYASFARALDEALRSPFDLARARGWLRRHLTSRRKEELRQLIGF